MKSILTSLLIIFVELLYNSTKQVPFNEDFLNVNSASRILALYYINQLPE